jgi:hypothetical protein
MLRRFLCILAACTAFTFSTASSAEKVLSQQTIETLRSWEGAVFRIEDAKSRVSIASVKLSVGDLKPENGYLVGEYTINIPLMTSKNDHGMIVLPLSLSLDELGKKGGVLRGQAISYKEGTTPNGIVCEIIPDKDQKILLEITTDDRTIAFKSRYSILMTHKDS